MALIGGAAPNHFIIIPTFEETPDKKERNEKIVEFIEEKMKEYAGEDPSE